MNEDFSLSGLDSVGLPDLRDMVPDNVQVTVTSQPPVETPKPHPMDDGSLDVPTTFTGPTQSPQVSSAPLPKLPDDDPDLPIADFNTGWNFGRMPSVRGMVIHHTAGQGDLNGVITTLNQRRLGVQFVIDREGKIHRLVPEGGRALHMRDGWGPGSGLSNSNMQGVEIIARNDKDVLPVQIAAAKNLVKQQAKRYGYDPTTSVFGHGEVNPGHKEADEGMSTVSLIRGGAGTPKLPKAMKVPARLDDIIKDAARVTGADAGYIRQLGVAESGLNPKADNGTARGIWQYTDPTWSDRIKRYGALYGIQNATPFDQQAAAIITGLSVKENREIAKAALGGRDPTYAEQYSVHFLGQSGGPKWLSEGFVKNPDAPAFQFVGEAQWKNNPTIFFKSDKSPRSNREVMALFQKKMTPAADITRDLSQRTDPTAPINPTDVWAPPPLPLAKNYTDAALTAKRMFHGEQTMGFWEGVSKSLTTTELTARAGRAISNSAFRPDFDYLGTSDHVADVEAAVKSLPEEFHGRLGGALSREHLANIVSQSRAEVDLNAALTEAGMKGLAARLASSLVDPVSLGAGIISGGVATGVATSMRMGWTASKLMGAAGGAAGNMAIDAGLAATAGDALDTTDLMQSAAIGALLGGLFGPIGANRALRQEAMQLQRSVEAVGRDPLAALDPPHLEAPPLIPDAAHAVEPQYSWGDGAPMAVGAAASPPGTQVERLSDPMFRAITQDSVPRTAIERLRLSTGGALAASENPIMRMAGGLLGVDMIGKAKGAANTVGADQDLARYMRGKQFEWRSSARPAYDEWAQAEGYNFWERNIGRGWDDFNQRVGRWVTERDPAIAAQEHPAIQRAGQTYRKMMKDMQEDQRSPFKKITSNGREDGSVAGAESLEPDPHYFTRVWSVKKLDDAIERFGEAGVIRVISGGIKHLQPNIDDDLAERFARSIIESKYTRQMGYDERLDSALSGTDTAIMAKMLRDEFRWTEDEIRRIMDQLRKNEPNVAPHLKHRIQMNEKFRMEGVNGFGTGDLGIEDLLERNADLVMNYYTRKTAGRVALARQQWKNPLNGDEVVDGIRSDTDFAKIKDAAIRWYEQNRSTVSPETARKELDNLQWVYDRIKGIPDPHQLSDWADWLRVAKNYNFARMMGQIGFAQLMDAPRIVGTMGVKAFMQQMRGFRRVVNEMDGQAVLRHGLDHELESLFGLGTDRLRGFVAMVWDEAGSVRSANRGRSVDKAQNVTETMAHITSEVSGMNYINSWLQIMVGRSAAQKFANMASGGRISRSDMRQLRFLGLDDDMLNRVLGQVRDKFTHENGALFGRRVAKMNLDDWTDIEARTAFEKALFRWSRHVVQENDIGSMHRMMSNPIAQVLLQFRSYSMTAWENQLLHGVANPDGRTFAQFSSSLLGGALVYATQTHLQAIGRSDAKDFLDKRLDPVNFGAAVFQRSGWSSLIPMIADSALLFTPADPIFGARPSGQATDVWFGNPLGSFAKDLQSTSKGVMEMFIQGKDLTQNDLRAATRLLAWQNTMPVIQGLSALISGAPTR